MKKIIFLLVLLLALPLQAQETFDLKNRNNTENAYEAVMEICIGGKLQLLAYDYIYKNNLEDFKGYIVEETEEEMVIILTDDDDLAIKTYWKKL